MSSMVLSGNGGAEECGIRASPARAPAWGFVGVADLEKVAPAFRSEAGAVFLREPLERSVPDVPVEGCCIGIEADLSLNGSWANGTGRSSRRKSDCATLRRREAPGPSELQRITVTQRRAARRAEMPCSLHTFRTRIKTAFRLPVRTYRHISLHRLARRICYAGSHGRTTP